LLLYLRPEESFPALAGARMLLTVSVTALAAWAINACLTREQFRFRHPAVVCFIGFLTVAIASTVLNSGDMTDAAMELSKLLTLFVLIVHLVNSESRLRLLVSTLLLSSTIMGAWAMWQHYSGQSLIQQGVGARALGRGIFGDPNDLALAMAMALPLALGALFGKAGGWTKLWSLATIPVLVWTVFITNSRGGMLALAAAIFVFFGRRLGRVGAILGAIVVLVLFAFGPSRLAQMNADEESAQGRVEAWDASLKMLQNSPLWGVGRNQFTDHHHRTAHNSFVLCYAELGLVGAALWVGLFYFAFRSTRRAAVALQERSERDTPHSPVRRRNNVWSYSLLLQVSLITFMVGGFFLSRTYTIPLYVYLGLATAAAQVEGESSERALPETSLTDWVSIGMLTLGGCALVYLLVQVWN
jgi:O-antigen ligase